MRVEAAEMARALGPDVLVVVYGSGSSEKTSVLVEALQAVAYVPVVMWREHLSASCEGIAHSYPET